jgi:hypothetical protein
MTTERINMTLIDEINKSINELIEIRKEQETILSNIDNDLKELGQWFNKRFDEGFNAWDNEKQSLIYHCHGNKRRCKELAIVCLELLDDMIVRFVQKIDVINSPHFKKNEWKFIRYIPTKFIENNFQPSKPFEHCNTDGWQSAESDIVQLRQKECRIVELFNKVAYEAQHICGFKEIINRAWSTCDNCISLRSIWSGMKDRCYNEKNRSFKYYGGRGIKVCDRWLKEFHFFVEDMGVRLDNCSIDRIDNDGDYEPNNCRWATAIEQANNTRRSEKYRHKYITITVAEFESLKRKSNEQHTQITK